MTLLPNIMSKKTSPPGLSAPQSSYGTPLSTLQPNTGWLLLALALLLMGLAGCAAQDLPVLNIGSMETEVASPLPPLPQEYMDRFDADQRVLTERPQGTLPGVVENYLQEFQPGPIAPPLPDHPAL